jgi:hypothetical protein
MPGPVKTMLEILGVLERKLTMNLIIDHDRLIWIRKLGNRMG